MALAGSTVLSLMLGDRSAVLAQVTTGKTGRAVQRVARFDAPENARLLDKPVETGALLGAFLAAHAFTAKKAVIGVPARWLIAQDRELPPIDAAAAANLLRLAAERLSLAESGALIADYAGNPDSKAGSRVLLVGILKPQLDKVKQLAEAAGLSVAAVCPTSLAVARVSGGDRNVLRLADDGAELVLQQNGGPRLLQSLTADPAALSAEVKRTLTMRGAAGGALLLCDGVGLTGVQSAELTTRLGIAPQPFNATSGIDVTVDAAARNGAAATLPPDAHWPAVALALAASERRGLPVNFIDSKLAVKPPSRFGRRTLIAAGVLILAAVGMFYLVSAVNDAEALEQQLDAQAKTLEKPVKEARVVLDQINYGRTYFETRPPTLDCLRQLTMAFNFDEHIWVNNITFRANGQGQLQGKSDDQRLILSTLDRIKSNPNFKDVQLQNASESGGKEQLKSFSIGFLFDPTTPAALPAKGAK